MKKTIILVLLVLAFFPIVNAQDYDFTSLSWNGTIDFVLEKDLLNETEQIIGTATIYNTEEYPLLGAKLALQIAQGTYNYPSQFNNEDNIIFEKIIDINGWVLPKSKRTISFQLPAQKTGKYRIDLYSSVIKSKFIGANWIFLSPISKEFTVEGNPKEKNLKIFRAITSFNDVVGPVGFPANAGEEIKGKIFVINPSDKQKTNLSIGIRICEWGSIFCENSPEKKFNLNTIAANEIGSVDVSINAPEIPSAYEIEIIVYNKEDIESIYKNRVIVSGGTAKVRKVTFNGLKDKNYSFDVLISGSPDHFSKPNFENFSLNMKLSKNDLLVEEKSIEIEKIIFDEIQNHNFSLSENEIDKACFLIEKSGTKFDEVCFVIPLEDLQANYDELNPKMVKITWTYEKSLKNLNIILTKETPMNSRVRISLDENTIYLEDIKGVNLFEKNFTQNPENLTLIVDDFDAKMQEVIRLNLRVDEELRYSEILNEQTNDAQSICNGIFCEEDTVCDSQTILVNDKACCLTQCIPQKEGDAKNNLFGIPLILWIALIVLVLATMIGSSVLKRVIKK